MDRVPTMLAEMDLLLHARPYASVVRAAAAAAVVRLGKSVSQMPAIRDVVVWRLRARDGVVRAKSHETARPW